MLPEYFHSGIFVKARNIHDHHIRQANNFHLPKIRHEFAKATVQFKIANFFNNIAPLFKEKIYTHSLDGFKKYVKTTIISNYPCTSDSSKVYHFYFYVCLLFLTYLLIHTF
jgi:hypothetical protein